MRRREVGSMVARGARSSDILFWLGKSWRVYRKRPLYLWVGFLLFSVVAVLPSYISPFGRIFSGFMLPLVCAGAYIFIHRAIRYKRATYEDLFFVFYDTRLGIRLLPVAFMSLFLWSVLGVIEWVDRQPMKYHLNQLNHSSLELIQFAANSLNFLILLGLTPILIFSSLNFIQALQLLVRSVKGRSIPFVLVWGGGAVLLVLSIKWFWFFVPVGTYLMVFWYVSFDGLFMIMDDPLESVVGPASPNRMAPYQEHQMKKTQQWVELSEEKEVIQEKVRIKNDVVAEPQDFYSERYQNYDQNTEESPNSNHDGSTQVIGSVSNNEAEDLYNDKTDEIGELTQTKTGNRKTNYGKSKK